MSRNLDDDRFGRRWDRAQTALRQGLRSSATDVAWRARILSQNVADRWERSEPRTWIPHVRVGGGQNARTQTVRVEEEVPRQREQSATGTESSKRAESTSAADSTTADIEMQPVGMFGDGVDFQRGGKWEVPKEASRPFIGEGLKLMLRVLDIALNLALLATLGSYMAATEDMSSLVFHNLQSLFALPLICCQAWQMAEITTQCARRGRGITPKAHIGVELTICMFLVAIIGIVAYASLDIGYSWSGYGDMYPVHRAFLSLLVCSSTIHICLFVDACFRRHREIKGRIAMLMYVPETGETVYVVAKSHSSREIPRVPARKLSVAPSRGVSSPPPSPGPPSRSRPQSPKTSPTAAHPPKPSDTDLLLAVLTSGRTDADASTPPATISPLASAVARKPLPPKPMPVDALHPPLGPGHEPPGPDYEPSTSELERRARGDAQPQMISPNDLALKFSASNTGMTPAPNQAKESKVLLDGMRLQRSNSF